MARKALCIGINNYPGTHMDLQGCVNDAQDWTDVLQSRGFVISALLDQQATKAAMMSAMRDLINNAVAGDSLVITFSGHGTYQPDKDGDEVDGLDEALCPYDIQTKGEALTDDEIHTLFKARKAGVKLVLISDSCHSGTVTRAAAAEPEADAPRPRFMPMGNWMPDKDLPRSRSGSIAPFINTGASTSPFLAAYTKSENDLLLSGVKKAPTILAMTQKLAGDTMVRLLTMR